MTGHLESELTNNSMYCFEKNMWEAPVFFRGYQFMDDRRMEFNNSANNQAYFYYKHIIPTVNCYNITPHPITMCGAAAFV